MSWFTEGYEAAEKESQQAVRRSKRKFWTRAGEVAVIRFLAPAKQSFNYKRAYVPGAKGDKYYTSPNEYPDPFIQAGYNLQKTFAWKIIDRRILEVGEEKKKIGPRMLYFADGPRTRNALLSFENDIRDQINEEREAEGKKPFSEHEYNLTNFDIRVKKDQGAPWYFSAIKGGEPKPLSDEDKELIENNDFDLKEELAPLPIDQIHALLAGSKLATAETNGSSETTEYAYGEDNEDEGTFFDE